MAEKKKKTVADIVIDSFIKRISEEGRLPWQNPHTFGVSINWVTKRMYRGINRIILPNGEYMTKNQLNKYNEEHGTSYRFIKGIKWLPVVFFKNNSVVVKPEDLEMSLSDGESYIDSKGNKIYKVDGRYYRDILISRYSLVADIRYFQDEEGNTLPRRIQDDDTGVLQIAKDDPERIIKNYIKASGVHYEEVDDGESYYLPSQDLVHVNPRYNWQDAKYSVTFHELAHSTGHESRLNRKGITSGTKFGDAKYSKEECIAEIATALLCQESGISDFVTSGTIKETNSIAYVSNWAKSIKDFGSQFISICKQAEQAYLYILGEDVQSQLSSNSSTER